MKNFRTILAAALMLCCATLSAQNFEVDGIFYNILSKENKTVEVKGHSHGYFGEYSGNVVIPANVTYNGRTYSVTTIGNSAFSNCDDHKSITIPNSVTTIGDKAFYYCRNLTSITIPNSVTTIGNSAFRACGLTSIEIPNSVTTIGDEAFYSCDDLTSITIPNSVTSIGDYAFYYCTGLRSISVAAGNTTYDSRDNCNAIIETATNTLIQGCKNTVIPNSVTTIGDYAFYNCTGLTSIVIPNSVTTIGNGAFSRCSGLTSIEIPNSVTTIGNNAFGYCDGLTSVTIGNSVTTIGKSAFTVCTELTSIVIPNSVTSIGDDAFGSCDGLTSIVVAEDNTIYDSREDCNAIIETATNTLIRGCKNTVIPNSVTTIGERAFGLCYDLTSIEIPNSVTTIGDEAFILCTGLTSIEIPNSVTTIGDDAFGNCIVLTSVTIGNSVTTIGESAFYWCRNLTSITSLIPADKLFIPGADAFYDVPTSCTLYVPRGAKETYAATKGWNQFTNIVESAYDFEVDGIFYNILSKEDRTVEVTYKGSYSDEYSEYSGNVAIPANVTYEGTTYSVTTIGDYAFYECWNLKSITIPNSVTTIGNSAFCWCTGLTSIEIPNSVTTIGESAFYYCESLTSITSLIPADKLLAPGSYAFNGVDKENCTLYVPAGAKETYATTEGWNEFTNIVEMKGYDLTVSAAGYATLYLDYNAIIPEGVEVYTASNIDSNYLKMQQVTAVLPANTGVIVRAEQGTYTFEQSLEKVSAITNNMLRGSVNDKYITPSKDAKYYVLAMKDGIVGMYEDALTGGTFKNNAHKAYLVLGEKNLGIYDEEVDTEDPGMQLSNSYYFDFSGTTAIEPVINEVEKNVYYDLSGRRVENPVQGIYIVNGKKVLIK